MLDVEVAVAPGFKLGVGVRGVAFRGDGGVEVGCVDGVEVRGRQVRSAAEPPCLRDAGVRGVFDFKVPVVEVHGWSGWIVGMDHAADAECFEGQRRCPVVPSL